jgi:hypothetical protein
MLAFPQDFNYPIATIGLNWLILNRLADNIQVEIEGNLIESVTARVP